MRHIEFSKYIPSADGAYYLNDKDVEWDLELTEESRPEDIPSNSHLLENIKNEDELPDVVKKEAKYGENRASGLEDSKISLENTTLTELMTLHGMEEEIAVEVIEYIQSHDIKSIDELLEVEGIDKQTLKIWAKDLNSKVDVNRASINALSKIKSIGKKLAKKIVEFRDEHGPFKTLEDMLKIKGIGKKKLDKIRNQISIK